MPDPPIPTSIGGGAANTTNSSSAASTASTKTKPTKKSKYGSNLTRTLVPTAPKPPVPSATTASTSGTGSLAFLSTKRSAASAAKGVAPTPRSAHDALLTAAAAEAGLVTYPKPEEKEKDAWGTVQKERETKAARERVEEERRRRLEEREKERTRVPSLKPGGGRGGRGRWGDDDSSDEEDRERRRMQRAQREREMEMEMEMEMEREQAYGAGAAANDPSAQPEAMARLARERAAHRRREEEERFRRQKEAAARRLRELEEKMGPPKAVAAASKSMGAGAPPPVRGPNVSLGEVENWRRRSTPQQLQSQIKLERLTSANGRSRSGEGAAEGSASGSGAGSSPKRSSPPSRNLNRLHSPPAKPTAGGGGGLTHLSGAGGGGGGFVAGVARSLWDPNTGKTFSSLVGGSSTGVTAEGEAEKMEEMDRQHPTGSRQRRHDPSEDDAMANAAAYDDNDFSRGDSYGGPDRGGKNLYDPGVNEYGGRGRSGSNAGGELRSGGGRDRRSNSNVSDHDRFSYEQGPAAMDRVIHVTDYETTDRGEAPRKDDRGQAAPRMLFDPTTGSMVAATARAPPSSGGGGRGERGGRGGDDERKSKRAARGSKRNRNKDDDGAGGALLLRRPSDADEVADGRGAGRGRGRKERASKRAGGAGADAGVTEAPKVPHRRKDPNKPRNVYRHPRTCGVLYTKDSRGRIVCADECEADQGYGAHSVPGGRVRNPAAYAAFLKEKKLVEEEKASSFQASRGYYDNGTANMGNGYGQDYTAYEGYGNSSAMSPGLVDEVAPEIPLVTADEDLKLNVGEDSPSLKPSAREFAPSFIPSAPPGSATKASDSKDGNDDDDGDDDDDELHAIGLGFDPTQNMDSVMMSPSNSPQKAKVEAEPFELALGQMSVDVDTEDPEGSPRMPFSSRAKKVEGSRLLGNVSAAWALSDADDKPKDSGTTFASSTFGNWGLGEGESNDQAPASFLSLNNANVGSSENLSSLWGGTGFGGLGDLGNNKKEDD